MDTLAWLFFSAMVVNNFSLSYFPGLCPFMGVSARVSTPVWMGATDTFVLCRSRPSAPGS
jgi:Na+-translocating ferredoxin:NAD+ oxidoreductase subunit A